MRRRGRSCARSWGGLTGGDKPGSTRRCGVRLRCLWTGQRLQLSNVQYSAAAILPVPRFRLFKYVAPEIGLINLIPNDTEYSKYGSSTSRERVTLLPMGVRGIPPLARERLLLRSEGEAAFAIDHGRNFRGWSDGASFARWRPIEEWFRSARISGFAFNDGRGEAWVNDSRAGNAGLAAGVQRPSASHRSGGSRGAEWSSPRARCR